MIGTTAAMLGLGALTAGGSIAGGLIGAGGARDAANASAQATQQAITAQQSQQQSNRSDISPWMSAGTNAIGQIGALLGYGSLWNRGGQGATYNFEPDPNAQANATNALDQYVNSTGPAVSRTFAEDPGYAFRLSEGSKALDRSAASKGMLLSGAQAKGLTDYNQNFASNEYGNWFNRSNTRYQNAIAQMFQTAGLGQSAAASLAGTNSGLTANGNNALLTGAGQAGAFGTQASNDIASGLGSGTNNALMAAYLFRNRGTGGGGASSYPINGYPGAATSNPATWTGGF